MRLPKKYLTYFKASQASNSLTISVASHSTYFMKNLNWGSTKNLFFNFALDNVISFTMTLNQSLFFCKSLNCLTKSNLMWTGGHKTFSRSNKFFRNTFREHFSRVIANESNENFNHVPHISIELNKKNLSHFTNW